MKIINLITLLLIVLLTNACTDSDDNKRATCIPTGPANDCYGNGSSCSFFILRCHKCCYDSSGIFKAEESEICGVCIP